MGSNFFHGGSKSLKSPTGTNLQARAGAAGGYASRSAAGGAHRDLAAAMGMEKAMKLKATTKTAASNAPGPKKV